ncbi:DUF2075 domain-containing protein [Mycoplasmatota bacterium]|nr:DUF2075 domain-containing protein [Mycoplasmatota bacterium]
MIKTYDFARNNEDIKNKPFCMNWPVVYIIEDGTSVYIGETNNFYNRTNTHSLDDEKKHLKRIHMITKNDFNSSVIADIESFLIRHFDADNQMVVLNKNGGRGNLLYYQKEFYYSKIPSIWERLLKKRLVTHDLVQIENSDLFKYSPYTSLSDDQLAISEMIIDYIKTKEESISIIDGLPGTGKTVLAMYLLKLLSLYDSLTADDIALVVPMSSLRSTLKSVVKTVKGLKASMVIGPADVVKKNYKILIVDEAHRLRRRVNITNYGSFDKVNKNLELDKNEGNELDWIMKSSRHQILFYDENQSVRPSDVIVEDFYKVKELATVYTLESQHRVAAGINYVNYIKNIFTNMQNGIVHFDNYDSLIIDDFSYLVELINNKDKEVGLSRVVSGYSFEWVSKRDKSLSDITLDGISMQWNTTASNWVNSKNALEEVGCIHTVQGYDLNYIGLIIGKDIDYDFELKKFIVDRDQYFDIKGKATIDSEEQLLEYIRNIYITLSTRAIKGIYFYICNDNMKKYMQQYFDTK